MQVKPWLTIVNATQLEAGYSSRVERVFKPRFCLYASVNVNISPGIAASPNTERNVFTLFISEQAFANDTAEIRGRLAPSDKANAVIVEHKSAKDRLKIRPLMTHRMIVTTTSIN